MAINRSTDGQALRGAVMTFTAAMSGLLIAMISGIGQPEANQRKIQSNLRNPERNQSILEISNPRRAAVKPVSVLDEKPSSGDKPSDRPPAPSVQKPEVATVQ